MQKISIHIRGLLNLFIFFFCLLAGEGVIFAQEKGEQEQQKTITEQVEEELGVDVIETTEGIDLDEYLLPTVENLSKLYWAIGKLDFDDEVAIDNYLLINECDMYLQFYHNDFEWTKIRDATRDHIMENMDEFPTRYELFAPISLGRYDVENELFEIEEESKLMGMRRIDFTMNDESYKETCGKKGAVDQYPANMIVILNRPIVLEQVPVRRELAEMYVEYAKRFYENLPLTLQLKRYERLAFIRLKIWVTQYKNTISAINGDKRAVVFGRLEGYEIYADPEKKKPLYFKDMKSTRFKRIRDRNKDEEEDLQVGQDISNIEKK